MRNIGHLNRAKKVKDDEFYTPYDTVQSELACYKQHLKDKTIYLPCDRFDTRDKPNDPPDSNFVLYLTQNPDNIEYKELYATSYRPYRHGSYFWYNNQSECPEDWGPDCSYSSLKYDGRFSNPECQELMAKADIIITNPPFSQFRKFLQQILDFGKDFIIMGDMNAAKYNVMYNRITNGEIRMTFNKRPNKFVAGDGRTVDLGAVVWYTNLKPDYNKGELKLTRTYNPDIHKPCLNRPEIIYCKSIRDIPYDYDGMIAAPINILRWDFSKQFEMLGFCKNFVRGGFVVEGLPSPKSYTRVVIRRR